MRNFVPSFLRRAKRRGLTRQLSKQVPEWWPHHNRVVSSSVRAAATQPPKVVFCSDSPKHDSTIERIKETIFDLYKNPLTDRIDINGFFDVLESTGLKKDDPRLARIMSNLTRAASEGQVELDKDMFLRCFDNRLGLVQKALKNQMIIPDWKSFVEDIGRLYENVRKETGGHVAQYIPQLSRVNPEYWGVSVCTVDGQRESFGDHRIPFCLQSVAKPFNYALAIDSMGADLVHNYVGQEPSGRFFNEICLDANSKPHNPMINAGAIVIASLINSKEPLSDRFDYMLKMMRRFSDEQFVGFKNAVFLSERETADRNYALAYYMREHGCFPPGINLVETLDFYFQLCSISTTTDSLAVMAATLANGGVSPLSNERVVSSTAIRDTLSVMLSCGCYDYSGQFAFKVGLPAKTGVSGNMMIIVPNCCGIALYSPRLDSFGNSVRGVKFAEQLVEKFNFHHYDHLVYQTEKADPRYCPIEQQSSHQSALFFAVKADDISTVKKQILSGMDIEAPDYDDRTVLHVAASEGNKETLNFLLSRWKGNPEATDRFGNTPLDNAKTFGYDECVQLLINAKTKSQNKD